MRLAHMWYVVPQYCGGSSVKFVCDWCAVNLFGGTVLAVVVICDCLVLGLWMRGFNSVVKLLGGRVQSGWCRLDGWWHCVGSCCDL